MYAFNSTATSFSKSSDRQRWNKSLNKELDLAFPDPMVETQRRYEEYLLNLQLNNQIMKLCKKKDPKREELEKRESGFSLYVNGAHKPHERYMPRHTIVKSPSSSSSASSNKSTFNFVPLMNTPRKTSLVVDGGDDMRCKSAPTAATATGKKQRKCWQAPTSLVIKTKDGCQIKIKAPHVSSHTTMSEQPTTSAVEEEYYSDDFESDKEEEEVMSSSPEITKDDDDAKVVEEENLIESVKISEDSSSSENDEEIVEELLVDNSNNNKEEDKQPPHASPAMSDKAPKKKRKKSHKKKKRSIHVNLANVSQEDFKFLRESLNQLDLKTKSLRNNKENNKYEHFNDDDEEPIEEHTHHQQQRHDNKLKVFTLNTSKSRYQPKHQLDELRHHNNNEQANNVIGNSIKSSSSICNMILENAMKLEKSDLEHLVNFLSKVDVKDNKVK